MQNDAKDRHVVATAVKAGAQVITTANPKDFIPLPEGLEAQSPDDFLCNLFDLDPDAFTEMLREQAADQQKPPISFDELLERLSRAAPACGRSARARATVSSLSTATSTARWASSCSGPSEAQLGYCDCFLWLHVAEG
jgi:hypothetical protein